MTNIAHSNADTTFTEKGITLFQLVILRGALKLEEKGLKSRRFNARKITAARYGLPPCESYEILLTCMESEISELILILTVENNR